MNNAKSHPDGSVVSASQVSTAFDSPSADYMEPKDSMVLEYTNSDY